MADERGHREHLRARIDERSSRAGRLSYIQFAVYTQKKLAQTSAEIKVQMADAEEHYGNYLTDDQKGKLLDARAHLMDAADKLHSVASELLGDSKRDVI